MELLVLGVGIAVVLAAHMKGPDFYKRQQDVLRDSFQATDITLANSTINANIRGARLTVRYTFGKHARTRFTLTAPWLPMHIWIGREDVWSQLKRGMGEMDFLVGEQWFDDNVQVLGQETTALCVLTKPARDALLDFVRLHGAKLEDGELETTFVGTISNPKEFADIVRVMLKLSETLRGDVAVPVRLAWMAENDPLMVMRQKALEAAVRKFPTEPLVVDLCRRLLNDRLSAMRVVAAAHLGYEGIPTLEAVVVDPDAPEDSRLMALQKLSRLVAPEALPAVLDRLWAVPPGDFRKAIGELWLQTPEPPALASLEKWLDSPDVVTLTLLTCHPASEPLLLSLLSHPDRDVRLLVVRALEKVGTVAAVPALRHISWGFTINNVYQLAVNQAISAILTRAGNPEEGRLALADDSGGSLSLPD